ncbi:ATP-binding protein [Streptomyces sp. NPDC098781]|uniref:ATP-binding protein n=1 Tax=Streptomyces sp. NPDC098781 TaxID=3366097 RepID=UPI003814BCFF
MSQEYRTGATTSPADRLCGAPRSPAEARGAVRRVVSEQSRVRGVVCTPDTLSDALLVTSELTTNAMLHGGGVTGFDVRFVDGDLHVSVCDRERRRPVARNPIDRHGRQRLGGRGWPIVCRLSRAVHVSDLPTGGKRVTAVIALAAECRRAEERV